MHTSEIHIFEMIHITVNNNCHWQSLSLKAATHTHTHTPRQQLGFRYVRSSFARPTQYLCLVGMVYFICASLGVFLWLSKCFFSSLSLSLALPALSHSFGVYFYAIPFVWVFRAQWRLFFYLWFFCRCCCCACSNVCMLQLAIYVGYRFISGCRRVKCERNWIL